MLSSPLRGHRRRGVDKRLWFGIVDTDDNGDSYIRTRYKIRGRPTPSEEYYGDSLEEEIRDLLDSISDIYLDKLRKNRLEERREDYVQSRMEEKIQKEVEILKSEIAQCYRPGEKLWSNTEAQCTEEQKHRRDKLISLGGKFLQAAEYGNYKRIQRFVDAGFPVNYQDPSSKLSALHVVAACKARSAFRVLLGSGECDYLLRDKKGRLSSELAFTVGKDFVLSRLLRKKEVKQGKEKGVVVTRRPRPN